MIPTYYIDESGHSGDMINSGRRYDFEGQPYFVLAAIGLEDAALMESYICELRRLHRIAPGELKSKSLQKKPRFVADLIDYVRKQQVPLFIELVDKRFLSAPTSHLFSCCLH